MHTVAQPPSRQLGLTLSGAPAGVRTKDTWCGRPVVRYTGPIAEVMRALPTFERRPFRIINADGAISAANEAYHSIVRLATEEDPHEVPLGIVSPSYQLVQHRSVLERLCRELRSMRVELDDVEAMVDITEHGERMSVAITLPDEERFCYNISAGDPMRARLHCFNSVDGSMRFSMVFGWLRFVCSNGLIIGTRYSSTKQIHNPLLDMDAAFTDVGAGLRRLAGEREAYRRWQNTALDTGRFITWLDGPLARSWGVQAAARALSICNSGHDCRPEPFERGPASRLPVVKGVRVVGSPEHARSAFDVSQALSWIAGCHTDVQSRFKLIAEVAPLVTRLVGNKASSRS